VAHRNFPYLPSDPNLPHTYSLLLPDDVVAVVVVVVVVVVVAVVEMYFSHRNYYDSAKGPSPPRMVMMMVVGGVVVATLWNDSNSDWNLNHYGGVVVKTKTLGYDSDVYYCY
jgi:hypothetical protein